MSVLVERFICLRYNKLVLFVSRHVDNLVENFTGRFIDLAERSFYKSVLIYLCKGRKI